MLTTRFGRPEVTLCVGQDVKLQLLTDYMNTNKNDYKIMLIQIMGVRQASLISKVS